MPQLRSEFDISTIRKDRNLVGLVQLLNSRPDVFKDWDYYDDSTYLQHYEKFLFSLVPWMIAIPHQPTHNQSALPFLNYSIKDINCSQDAYQHVLSGTPLSSPRIIVDFIPFGCDIDKLELRLHQNYFGVTAFVIFESPVTQTGKKSIDVCHNYY